MLIFLIGNRPYNGPNYPLLKFLGQAEDQVCAGPLAVLLCIQLGYGPDSEHIFKLLKSPLLATLQDPTARIPARASVSKILISFFYCQQL